MTQAGAELPFPSMAYKFVGVEQIYDIMDNLLPVCDNNYTQCNKSIAYLNGILGLLRLAAGQLPSHKVYIDSCIQDVTQMKTDLQTTMEQFAKI